MRVSPLTVSTDRESGATGEPGDLMPFEGFDPPESNFWRLPNNWFDLAARFTSWAEHKVVEYILRHTWGYHEYDMVKLITMDEFMHGRKRRDGSRLDAGCGMAENSIKKGIADAVAHGFLIVEVDDSDRGRIKKYYAPRMRRPVQDEGAHGASERLPRHRQSQSLTPQGQSLTLTHQVLTPEVQQQTPSPHDLILSPSALDPRTEQTPLVTHSRQNTEKQHSTAAALSAGRVGRKGTSSQTLSTRTSKHAALPSRQQARSTAALGQIAGIQSPFPSQPGQNDMPAQGNDDLVERLVAEGIGARKARTLVSSLSSDRIERQLAWIDDRGYRNRAATLVAAIEGDFGPPAGRSTAPERAGFDRDKYYRGSYALCPRCGARPCVPGCTEAASRTTRRDSVPRA